METGKLGRNLKKTGKKPQPTPPFFSFINNPCRHPHTCKQKGGAPFYNKINLTVKRHILHSTLRGTHPLQPKENKELIKKKKKLIILPLFLLYIYNPLVFTVSFVFL